MAKVPEVLEEVCIIGLGYVGLTLAVAMADAGYRVHGVETSERIRKCIKSGRAHFTENGLDAHLAKHVGEERLTCSDVLPAPGTASVYIVTVGTPLTPYGSVNLRALDDVATGVAAVLQDGDAVILRSTVKTGTCRSLVKAKLDAAGREYCLAFCPERTLEGKALQELRSLPQVVGGVDDESVDRAAAIFSVFAPKIVRVASLEEAELTKLISNTHRDLMFAFANEIAGMCDAVGASATRVIRAAGEDYPRARIALPGPVGGPCLEKDPHILAEGLREAAYTPYLSLTGRRLNEELPKNSMQQVAGLFEKLNVSRLGRGNKISILGLAFKGRPETNDLRGTMAGPIINAARARWPQVEYCGFDPVVDPAELRQFGLHACGTLEEAFDNASLILIQNNHEKFARMDLARLMARMAIPGVVYDYWNLFDEIGPDLPHRRLYCGLGTLVDADRRAAPIGVRVVPAAKAVSA